MQDKKNIAVTLVEILVTLIILAILIALVLPQFSTMRERSLSKEAMANLKLIDAAEKIYRMEEGFYYPYSSSVSDQQDINVNLKIAITAGNWGYDIAGNSGASYVSAADRNGAGGYLDCEYSMSDTTAEPSPNASCP
ncbi:MAG: prepilin-type N-terminal cleavage/methylation domain-containing protein [bacterium]